MLICNIPSSHHLWLVLRIFRRLVIHQASEKRLKSRLLHCVAWWPERRRETSGWQIFLSIGTIPALIITARPSVPRNYHPKAQPSQGMWPGDILTRIVGGHSCYPTPSWRTADGGRKPNIDNEQTFQLCSDSVRICRLIRVRGHTINVEVSTDIIVLIIIIISCWQVNGQSRGSSRSVWKIETSSSPLNRHMIACLYWVSTLWSQG